MEPLGVEAAWSESRGFTRGYHVPTRGTPYSWSCIIMSAARVQSGATHGKLPQRATATARQAPAAIGNGHRRKLFRVGIAAHLRLRTKRAPFGSAPPPCPTAQRATHEDRLGKVPREERSRPSPKELEPQSQLNLQTPTNAAHSTTPPPKARIGPANVPRILVRTARDRPLIAQRRGSSRTCPRI